MIAVIQRVKHSSVSIDGVTVGECNRGLMILLGVANGDTREDADIMLQKIAKLRIFSDDAGKMNLSICDIDGEMLVVSQFTLLANYKHGNRPDYMNAAPPAEANALYEYFKSEAKKLVRHVGSGEFGADMQVEILNDGPVTIVMDSEVLKKKGKS